MIDIVMLTTSNRWQFTRLAIEELAHRTTTPYGLIAVNCGDSYTQTILAEMVGDGLVEVAILLASGCDVAEGWAAGMALAGPGPVVQVTDEWMPPADAPSWLETLVATAQRRPEYGMVALRPTFFPKGSPPLVYDGDLLMTPWIETSFRYLQRGVSAIQDRSGYLADVRAEYLPSTALAWHYPR